MAPHPVRHVFVCTNRRERPLSCGLRSDAPAIAEHLKRQLDESGVSRAGAVQVAKTKCLGRCLQGPILTVSPDKVWYTYADEHDIDEIVAEHFVRGRVVERLLLTRPEAPSSADTPRPLSV